MPPLNSHHYVIFDVKSLEIKIKIITLQYLSNYEHDGHVWHLVDIKDRLREETYWKFHQRKLIIDSRQSIK